MECRVQLEELSLLQVWGAKLCFTIIGPSQVRSPLSPRMWVAILCHTEMAGELAVLLAGCLLPRSWCRGACLVRPLRWKL
jgi:hypothetical protein